MATTLDDIHPHIIHTHILPRLDGPSLSATGTASSSLQALCSDDTLWSGICNSTWPSINDPRLHDLISTFPGGYRSFFQDSFPALITHMIHHRNRPPSCSKSQPDCSLDLPSQSWPSEIISAVDIRYQNDIIYSRLEFTDTTKDFQSPVFRIELNDKPNSNPPVTSRTMDLKVDEFTGADNKTLSHLKECLTLNWILIDPIRKRAANLSSIKPVGARQDWTTNETRLRYVTVLPGREPTEVVQCRIQLVLGVGDGGVGLYVKEVMLRLQDIDGNCLNKRDFFVIMQGAISEEKKVRRKVVDDKERWSKFMEFKQLKMERRKWVRNQEKKREFAIKASNLGMFLSFIFSLYFMFSCL